MAKQKSKKKNWTYRANGDANSYTIFDGKGNWVTTILLNGEFTETEQIEIIQSFIR